MAVGLLIFIIINVWALLAIKNRAERNAAELARREYARGYDAGFQAARSGGGLSPEERLTPLKSEPTNMAQEVEDDTFAVDSLDEVSVAGEAETIPPEDSPQPSVTSEAVTAEQAAQKDRAKRTTINVALYTASLLLVAGILLLAQAMELAPIVRFAIIWLMIGVYYLTGWVLYARTPVIKPAAVAFVGTALAAVPFGGIVMHSLIGLEPAWCWLLTSLIGAGLLVDATIRFNSSALSYVAILAFFITSVSMPAVMAASLVWYYVVLLLFGVALTILARLSSRMPAQFTTALHHTSPVIVPGVMVLLFSTLPSLTELERMMLCVAGMVYHGAVGLTMPSGRRRTYELTAARTLGMASALLIADYLLSDTTTTLAIAVAAAAANMVASLIRLVPRERRVTHDELSWWLGSAFVLLWASMAMAVAHWTSWPAMEWLSLAAWAGLLVVSAAAVVRLRRPELVIGAMIASLVLPQSALVVMQIYEPYASAFRFTAFVAAAIIMLVLRIALITSSPAPRHWLVSVYGSVSLWLLVALIQATGVTHPLLLAAVWCGVVAVACMVVIWRERAALAVTGVQLAVLGAGSSLGLHFDMQHIDVLIMLAWCNLLFVGVAAYLGDMTSQSTMTHRMRDVLAQLSLILSIAMCLISFHPAVWLPLVVATGYCVYLLRTPVSLGGLYLSITLWLGSWLYWLHWPLADILAAVSWITLLGFGGSYWWLRERKVDESFTDIALAATVLPPVVCGVASLAASSTESGITVLAWLPLVIALYLLAYCKRAMLVAAIGGNTSLVILELLIIRWLGLEWSVAGPAFGMVTLLVFYGAGQLCRYFEALSSWRTGFVWSAVGWSALFILLSMQPDLAHALWALIVLALAGTLSITEGWRPRYTWAVDMGVVMITIGIHHCIVVINPEAHIVIFGHVWATALTAMALISWHWRSYAHPATISHVVLALSCFTLPTLNAALSGESLLQIMFLIEQALLVVLGLLRGARLLSIWGAVCVTLALFYLLSSYTYILAILIGLAIIIAVIIAIVRANRKGRVAAGE
ncbi:MAG: hypothetical protein Q4F02_00050 [Candidatus Saccharibacteria bacterium]|nr:hypothetical protein [Candidatus Saccharibacteria bacterium]